MWSSTSGRCRDLIFAKGRGHLSIFFRKEVLGAAPFIQLMDGSVLQGGIRRGGIATPFFFSEIGLHCNELIVASDCHSSVHEKEQLNIVIIADSHFLSILNEKRNPCSSSL